MGRALTKSINLECSAVFLLENRPRVQLPYAINGLPQRGGGGAGRGGEGGTGIAEEKKEEGAR